MEKAMGRDFGIRSRSLQAIYYLKKVGGYTNVRYMQGGFYAWDEAELPVEEFNDPDAKPFAQRNLPKMIKIGTFLLFVTSIKSGLVNNHPGYSDEKVANRDIRVWPARQKMDKSKTPPGTIVDRAAI
jgi:hypothetical protein